jgi:hypothetical protein
MNRSFMDRSCDMNNKLMKLRNSIHNNKEREKEKVISIRNSIPVSKSTEKTSKYFQPNWKYHYLLDFFY